MKINYISKYPYLLSDECTVKIFFSEKLWQCLTFVHIKKENGVLKGKLFP